MINAVGRDIPEEILKATGKKYFRVCIILTDMSIKNTDRK